MRVLFVHRSVGRNLMYDGELRQRLRELNPSLELSDYDHNTDSLTTADNIVLHPGYRFPANNTRPADYAQIFRNDAALDITPTRDWMMSYDLIVLKSCYPNSNIGSDDKLETIKRQYQNIGAYFKQFHGTRLLIMTSPPMTTLLTTGKRAARARKLANWLLTNNWAPNIHVFDLFGALAEPSDSWLKNRLRLTYQRWLAVDSHPNIQASRDIAPSVAASIVSATKY